MKLTKSRLKQLIKEELSGLPESSCYIVASSYYDEYDREVIYVTNSLEDIKQYVKNNKNKFLNDGNDAIFEGRGYWSFEVDENWSNVTEELLEMM
jgi:hypothetical protein